MLIKSRRRQYLEVGNKDIAVIVRIDKGDELEARYHAGYFYVNKGNHSLRLSADAIAERFEVVK